ncbi:MAG: lysostaphin resistance A-like protein [Pyrinomonadaceae bacterium]
MIDDQLSSNGEVAGTEIAGLSAFDAALTEPRVPYTPILNLLWALATWLISVACLFFIPLLVVLPYIVYLVMQRRMPTADLLGTDKSFLLLSILGVFPAHLLTFIVAWFIATRKGQFRFWKVVAFEWPTRFRPRTTVAVSTGLALLLLGIGGLITTYFGGPKTQLDQLIESSVQARVATALLAVATGPFIEEVIYRGMLYPAIERVMGMAWAVAIVSIMFTGVHVLQYYNNLGVISVIALLSLTLTAVRAFTRSLIPSFLIHLIFNGVQSIILLVQPLLEKTKEVAPKSTPAFEHLVQILRHLIV